VVVVVWWIFTDNNTTPTKVVLSCFGLLVGLWQYWCLFYISLGMQLIALNTLKGKLKFSAYGS
jgi:hypothetical protein